MKKQAFLALAMAVAIPTLACAAKPKKGAVETVAETQVAAAPEEEPTITEECVINVSLFNESVKNKQFQDAYEPWWETYQNCPNANKAIYTQGAKIVEYLYKKATDPVEKERLRKLAIDMHDKRIKYFGNDPKYPAAYVLGEKGVDYCLYYSEDPTPAYPWLKESVEKMGNKSKIDVLVSLFRVSYMKYKAEGDSFADQFITDYSIVNGYLNEIAKNPLNKNAAAAQSNADQINVQFAASGAADCNKLDELYATTVQNSQNDLEVLGKIVRLYKRVDCEESEVYFAASAASHKLQPTEESAYGCARMCMKKGDYRQAVEYLQQAIQIDIDAADEDEDQAKYNFLIAQIYMEQLKNYSSCREYCRKSLESLSETAPANMRSRCYMLIGMAYASSKPYSSDNMPAAKASILNKTVFWAAVDKFQKAKAIDPACAADADKLINAYSKYFPTKEEMFDLPGEFGGATFTVGGWIGESTVCRSAK